jgi:hypothetical protein
VQLHRSTQPAHLPARLSEPKFAGLLESLAGVDANHVRQTASEHGERFSNEEHAIKVSVAADLAT